MTASELNQLAAEAERDAQVCVNLFELGELSDAQLAIDRLKLEAKQVRLTVEIVKALDKVGRP